MENLELIKKAEADRLNMIIAAKQSGDQAAYEKAKASYVNAKGEIVFPAEEKQPETEAEKLDAEIAALENEKLMGEYMDFLPAGYYRKLDKLDALRAQRKQMGAK